MGVINFPELTKVGDDLETALKSLKRMQGAIESRWPATPEGEYFQILIAVARIDEALEHLRRVIRGAEKEAIP